MSRFKSQGSFLIFQRSQAENYGGMISNSLQWNFLSLEEK